MRLRPSTDLRYEHLAKQQQKQLEMSHEAQGKQDWSLMAKLTLRDPLRVLTEELGVSKEKVMMIRPPTFDGILLQPVSQRYGPR
jgi:hypothetical protein